MVLNYGAGEDSWESLGLQGDPTSPSQRKSDLNIHGKDWCWSWSSLWLPDANSWLIGKDPDAGKNWGHEEKGATEDEMVGWQHQLNGHEFAQTPGDGEGQGSLACCCPWGYKELDVIEWVNNNSEQRPWRQFKFCTTLGLLWLWGKVYKNNYNTIWLSCQAMNELFERRDYTPPPFTASAKWSKAYSRCSFNVCRTKFAKGREQWFFPLLTFWLWMVFATE